MGPVAGKKSLTLGEPTRLIARQDVMALVPEFNASSPERERRDTALAESEARYRALVRASSSLVWTSAADGQIVDMPEWRALSGQTVDEVQGWGWLNALHPDDRGRTQLVWQAAVDSRSIYETEYRIRRWDGQYVWHQARGVAVFEDDGSIREWVGICVDIEDRKRATQQQIEAEKALRALNDTLEQRVEAQARERARIWHVSQDMLVVADTEGRFLNVNPAWTAALGWSESDLVGNTSGWLLHPDDQEKTHAELAQLAERHRTLRFESRLRHKSGSYRWLSWTAVPDRGLVYAVARDITEIRIAEEQLRAARRELAAVSRQTMMGAMTASIAHEIKQPLAAIMANAYAGSQWLNRAELEIDAVREILKQIGNDANRANEVIAGIRSMFGKDRHEKSAVSVTDLVSKVLALVHGELQSHQVSLRNEMLHDLPQVMAERVQLQQVFVNLIMNAVDAMSAVTDRERILTIKSKMYESHHVQIMLEDTGTGIDPSHMERIFDAFFTTKSDGMGMGLSICRSIIESHGGRLSASPGHPHGSAFEVVLPSVALGGRS
jgi:PAS domain S-box-containing protein